jgi:hypothetical protein
MNGHFLRFEIYIMGVVQKEERLKQIQSCTSRQLLPFIQFRVNEETVVATRNGRVLA